MSGDHKAPLLVEARNQDEDVSDLRSILKHATDALAEGHVKSDPYACRFAIQRMVMRLIELFELDEEIKNEKLTAPLEALVEALFELNLGRRPDLLAPEKIETRPQNSWPESSLQGVAAGVMNVLMESGRKKREAARIVARELNRVGYSLRGRCVTENTIINWRDKASAEGNDDPSMLRVGYLEVQAARNDSTSPLPEIADRALALLEIYSRQKNLHLPRS